MRRKKLIIAILAGVAVAGTTFYLLGTRSGKKEWNRLKKTGRVAAGTFGTFGEEVARNVKQSQREERNNALKVFVREALAV